MFSMNGSLIEGSGDVPYALLMRRFELPSEPMAHEDDALG